MHNKDGYMQLKLTSKKQNPVNSNVVFYNTDTGTATLNFMLIEDDLPLMISQKNTHTFLILKTAPDHYIVDDVEYTDPINGKVSYTIPNDFLSLPGKVHGQLYIGIRGTDEVLTEVDFYFEIKDAVINTIPTVDKIKSIRTFAELEKNIALKVEQIESYLKNSDKSYNDLKMQLENGISLINRTKENAIKDVDSSKANATSSIIELKDKTLKEMDDSKRDIIQSVNSINTKNTDDWQKISLTQSNGSTISIYDLDFDNPTQINKSGFYYLYNPINGPIDKNGMLSVTYTNSNYIKFIYMPYSSNDMFVRSKVGEGNWLPWQKIESTETSRKWLGTLDGDIFKLKAGLYECYISNNKKGTNSPKTDNTLDYNAYIDVYDTTKGKLVEFYDLKNNDKYRGTYDKGTNVLSWKKEYSHADNVQAFYETEWINFQLENGVKDRSLNSDVEKLYSNQYKVVKTFNVTQVFFRINISNLVNSISNDNTIGRIPPKLVKDSQTFYIRSSITRSPVICTIKIDGTIKVYVNSNDKSNWTNEDYAIGSTSWLLDNDDYFAKKPTSIYIEGEGPDDLENTNFVPNITGMV